MSILALLVVTAVIDKLPDRAAIDWTQGILTATGAGAADVRAPGVDVARVAAERLAKRDAARRLVAAAHAVPGATVTGDELDAVVARARVVERTFGSDGSVTLQMAVPLEALRAQGPTPAGDAHAPTAIVVDARGVSGMKPTLGASITVGEAHYAGPTIWTRAAPDAARHDPRAGARPVATHAKDAHLLVDLEEAKLAAAAAAGALVIVVVP
jgi:hypothetical protein